MKGSENKYAFFRTHIHQLLKRYFQGKANKREREIIETWEAPRDTENNPNFSDLMEEEDRIEVYKRLKEHFNIHKYSKGSRPVNIFSRIKKQMTIAASITILLGVTSYLLWESNLISTPQDTSSEQSSMGKVYFKTTAEAIKEIRLPDSTVVYLNRGSELYIIKDEFGKNKREVWINGEAFFDVAKDQKKSFVINSGKLQTVVHGTSFNIKAYEALNEFSVTVRSGVVEVIANEKSMGILTHNQQLISTANGQTYTIENANWEDASGWLHGRTILKDADFDELKLRLSIHFGVEVVCLNDTFQRARLNAIIMEDSSLKEVMDNICWLYKAKYKIVDKRVIIE